MLLKRSGSDPSATRQSVARAPSSRVSTHRGGIGIACAPCHGVQRTRCPRLVPGRRPDRAGARRRAIVERRGFQPCPGRSMRNGRQMVNRWPRPVTSPNPAGGTSSRELDRVTRSLTPGVAVSTNALSPWPPRPHRRSRLRRLLADDRHGERVLRAILHFVPGSPTVVARPFMTGARRNTTAPARLNDYQLNHRRKDR